MSYITAIGTANPPHRFSQSTLAAFMVKAMQLKNGESRKLNAVFKASGIQYRHSVLEDYGRSDNFDFYSNTLDFEPFPSTEKRINSFRQHALKNSAVAIEAALKTAPHVNKNEITHLIVVCCTGMYAPGLDIDIVNHFQFVSSVQRVCINFMGCYAAFNALKVGDAFCKADPNAKVLIVCTELCSLHFQKKATPDNILANALFADGSAAVLLEGQANEKLSLAVECFQSDLITEGDQDMAWTIGDLGFEMRLSSYVPDVIKGGIKKLTEQLLQKIEKRISDIKYFAIHPGGKKILQVIERELNISPDCNAFAYHVLNTYGNMSSPTVLFVLKEIMNTLQADDDGEHILSFAFGPGLTLESMILKIKAS